MARHPARGPGGSNPPSVSRYPRVASFRTPETFRAHLRRAGVQLEFDDELTPPPASPLARPFEVDGVQVGNRFCILPMEGWDGTITGEPSDLTRRRWQRFGSSGAKLIWGGEAVAVRADGRANPNQLLIDETTLPSIVDLREQLVRAHGERFGAHAEDDLYIGLQLTHSGRFARPFPTGRPQPLTAASNPVLDQRFSSTVLRQLSDDDIDRLVDDFVRAAVLARSAGFRFVDVKHCHGYFGHELLGARHRVGRYGGSLENRTRFMRGVIAGIRAEAPGLEIAVRLSVFDTVPFTKGPLAVGVPEASPSAYDHAFGLTDVEHDEPPSLDDARCVLRMLESLNVRVIIRTSRCHTHPPHVQRLQHPKHTPRIVQ
jgi:NADPH2 dehydrogenase